MSITAIETRYAGCRFRSRLEARWAVFFDTLNIKWEYEPQGFMIGGRVSPAQPYLPDFYLTDSETWVEVKGQINSDELTTLAIKCVDPWAGGTLPSERLLIVGEIPDPYPQNQWSDMIGHQLFTWHKGAKAERHIFDTRPGSDLLMPYLDSNADDCPWDNYLPHYWDGTSDDKFPFCYLPFPNCTLKPYWHLTNRKELHNAIMHNIAGRLEIPWQDMKPQPVDGYISGDPNVTQAYSIARAARFEHGETP